MNKEKIINILTVIVILASVFMAGVTLANGAWLNCILEITIAVCLAFVYYHGKKIQLSLELSKLRRDLMELIIKIDEMVTKNTDKDVENENNDNNEHSN